MQDVFSLGFSEYVFSLIFSLSMVTSDYDLPPRSMSASTFSLQLPDPLSPAIIFVTFPQPKLINCHTLQQMRV